MNLALSEQVHLYLLDTAAFYTDVEHEIQSKVNKFYNWITLIEKSISKYDLDEFKIENAKSCISKYKKNIKKLKEDLKVEMNSNYKIRHLRETELKDRNVVSMFESFLTRCIGLSPNEITKDVLIVRTYYYTILKDLVLNGFMFNGEKYVILTASAGQIRTKKTVFIKESTWLKHKLTLMCGLTEERISEINTNKYLAYLALCNSATDKWDKFDIDKSIVVDDMELKTRGLVDYIDDKTFDITRQEMDIEINHTDGAGLVLPRVSDKNFMARLPWVKGLFVVFPYDKFIEKYNCSGKVKDIYGKEHDIIKDDIQVIFTKSQFKMWSYYESWDEYKMFFKKYECEASFCNLEPTHFKKSKLSYQMLQSLHDITDDEITILSSTTNETIRNVGKDRKTQLKLLGLNKSNDNKSYFQKSIESYPALLTDKYTKEIIKDVKKSFLKSAHAGKLEVNGFYTFVVQTCMLFVSGYFLERKNQVVC